MLKCISVFFYLKLWFLVGCCSQCTENYEHKLNIFLPEKDRGALLKNIFPLNSWLIFEILYSVSECIDF